jgi:hypothetical protein
MQLQLLQIIIIRLVTTITCDRFGRPEVTNDECVLVLDQYVLRFDISVDHTLCMDKQEALE